MGWVSWHLYIFVFLASFSSLWWPNIWSKIGFPELFEKNYWFHSLHKLLRYLKYHDTLVGKMMPKFFWNSHLCSTRLQSRNLYWIFLDEVGSDQSGGILSPFICLWAQLVAFVKYNFQQTRVQISGICPIAIIDTHKIITTEPICNVTAYNDWYWSYDLY